MLARKRRFIFNKNEKKKKTIKKKNRREIVYPRRLFLFKQYGNGKEICKIYVIDKRIRRIILYNQRTENGYQQIWKLSQKKVLREYK